MEKEHVVDFVSLFFHCSWVELKASYMQDMYVLYH